MKAHISKTKQMCARHSSSANTHHSKLYTRIMNMLKSLFHTALGS